LAVTGARLSARERELEAVFDWPAEWRSDLALLHRTTVETARYTGWKRERGVPIRTTVGTPRFWRSDWQGELVFVSGIAPYGVFKNPKLPELEDRHRAYRLRCDDYAGLIVEQLANTARAFPGETLCLLCFEDVHAGQVCHRRWFADWFETRFGLVVPEAT
jgi:hypothetical protein